METTLIAPTFNEIETIPFVLPKILSTWVDEIIVVDNNSTDGTIQWCQEHGYRVLVQNKPGYGNGMREAVNIAKGDIIIEFPPDGSSIPEKIPLLIEKICQGYDLVIASRYLDGAKSQDDTFMTGVGNWGFTNLTNILFRTAYTDVLCGYRAYRKNIYDKVNMDAAHLSWCIQSSIRFANHGYRVGEISADEPKRIGGIRKMKPFRTGLEILYTMVKELRQ